MSKMDQLAGEVVNTFAGVGKVLRDRLHDRLDKLCDSVNALEKKAGDKLIQKYRVEYNEKESQSKSNYFDGIVRTSEVALATAALFGCASPMVLAKIFLAESGVMAIGSDISRMVFQHLADKAIANRHPLPKEHRYNPKVGPDLELENYPGNRSLQVKCSLAEVDRCLDVLNMSKSVPVIADFFNRHGSRSPEEQTQISQDWQNMHPKFNTVISNLRKQMEKAVSYLDSALYNIKKMPDDASKRHRLEEFAKSVESLSLYANIITVKDQHGVSYLETMRKYQSELHSMSAGLSGLGTTPVQSASSTPVTGDYAPIQAQNRARSRP
jgi:hypothetical protein